MKVNTVVVPAPVVTPPPTYDTHILGLTQSQVKLLRFICGLSVTIPKAVTREERGTEQDTCELLNELQRGMPPIS